jgi:quinoprotein glucose dehydrogenase
MRRTLFLALLLAPGAAAQESPELEVARKKLAPAPDLEVALWASDPLLQNPVAIAFDEKGRCYVAECHRRHTSTLDIHMRKEWLDDDLACRRHEDLIAYHERRLGEKAKDWRIESERIRLLSDPAGKGRATEAVTYSDGYHDLGEGIGAGIVVRDGTVWYTCIPNLWLLKDTKGDGTADVRKALHTGFGVHLGASGHDMHGLRFGPDGKLYWSHGDRGFHVEAEGKVIDFPDGGGVLRSNPDGSELELVCQGLRNPQELAFDQYGNLFTGDNNISIAPDVGETCRWTYIVEGADYGWRIGYQFMPTGGAWCGEEQWRLEAGFQVPCVARLGHGPSGVTYHPGVAAVPDRYKNHFFMCDYPGGVWSFEMRPKGASFEMVDLAKLVWNVNPPDVEFGNDGAIYVADWVGMWDKVDKGRIWRLSEPSREKDAAVLEVKRLIAEGMATRPVEELATLLGHADQRIRQNAQFELASRKAQATLERLTGRDSAQLVRIHALWALGQMSRGGEIESLLGDADPEIRAQAAKVLGGLRWERASARLRPMLQDGSPRVRFFAAMALGKLAKKEAVAPLVEFLRANNNDDRMLQHAGIMGLTWIGDIPSIVGLAKDPSPAVRMAGAVALRKLKHPQVAVFLDDADPRIVVEAARAIYDTPIPEAMAALAGLSEKAPELALVRAANAAFRTGQPDHLARVAESTSASTRSRIEAIDLLGLWDKGLGRDRLMGLWRPVAPRDRAQASRALGPCLAKLVRDGEVAAAALRLKEAAPLALEVFQDPSASPQARAEALRVMERPDVTKVVQKALEDPDPRVARQAVLRLEDPVLAEKIAGSSRPVPVRQAAILLLDTDALARVFDAGLPPALALDWLLVTERRPALQDRRAKVDLEKACLEGGDPTLGRKVFFERSDLQCVRCHKIRGEGGEVGPDLTKIAEKKDAAYLLESVLYPNKQIAEGWGQTAFQLQNDSVEVGRIEKETDAEVILIQNDGSRKTIAKSGIRARKAALSAMPEELGSRIEKRDLRDLVAFLLSLK